MYDVGYLLSEPLLLEPLKGAVLKGKEPAYLRSVKFKLTARCNLRCVMCRYGKGLDLPEMATHEVTRALDQLADAGCRKVHFSGGEVFARRDFLTIAEKAVSLGLKVTLTSNLTLVDKGRARALATMGISSISTSLDGACARTHERVRGVPGSFRKTLRALAWLQRYRKKAKPRVRINFVMLRDNYREYPELLRLAARLGVSEVLPMPVDASADSRLRLGQRDLHHYQTEVAPQVQALRQSLGFGLEEQAIYPFGRGAMAMSKARKGQYAAKFYRKNLCYVPYLHMFVAWDGHVYLCCMTNGRMQSLGNLRTQSVREVFWGERFQSVRRSFIDRRLPSCDQCDMHLEENAKLAQAIPLKRAKWPKAAPAQAGEPRRLPVLSHGT